MNKKHIMRFFLFLSTIILALFLSLHYEKKVITSSSPQYVVLQYVDSHTFKSLDLQTEWLGFLPKIFEKIQSASPGTALVIVVEPEVKELIPLLHNLPVSIIIESVDKDLLKSPVFQILERFSSEDFLTIVSPEFLCDLYKVAQTDEIFLEALLGLSLDSHQMYLFSHFDQGVFRVDPQLIISLSSGFQKDFAQKLQSSLCLNTKPYRNLLKTRNLLDQDNISYNRQERLKWLQENPSISVFEPGFFSQIEGEEFWQHIVWNCNSRYIIAPLNWPNFSSYKAYAPIIPFSELNILFPEHSEHVSHFLLAYNDYVYSRDCHSAHSLEILKLTQSLFSDLPYKNQKKFEEVYGEQFVTEIMA